MQFAKFRHFSIQLALTTCQKLLDTACHRLTRRNKAVAAIALITETMRRISHIVICGLSAQRILWHAIIGVFCHVVRALELRNDNILEIAPPQKIGPNFQTSYSKSMIMVSYCWKNNGLTNETKNNDMFVISLKKLTIIRVPFFLGHAV